MTEQFKVGDLVYCPTKTRKILQVKHNPHGYLLNLETDIRGKTTYLSLDGRMTLSDINPVIFRATPENHELLCKLYGMEFEEPPTPKTPNRKTPKEIIQAMLGDGWVCVACYVSDGHKNPSNQHYADVIVAVNGESFMSNSNIYWRYVTPIDPRTGKVIIDYVDGEIITE